MPQATEAVCAVPSNHLCRAPSHRADILNRKQCIQGNVCLWKRNRALSGLQGVIGTQKQERPRTNGDLPQASEVGWAHSLQKPRPTQGQGTFNCKILCSDLLIDWAVVALQPSVGLAVSSWRADSKRIVRGLLASYACNVLRVHSGITMSLVMRHARRCVPWVVV